MYVDQGADKSQLAFLESQQQLRNTEINFPVPDSFLLLTFSALNSEKLCAYKISVKRP